MYKKCSLQFSKASYIALKKKNTFSNEIEIIQFPHSISNIKINI